MHPTYLRWRMMSPEQLTGRYHRLKHELSIAYTRTHGRAVSLIAWPTTWRPPSATSQRCNQRIAAQPRLPASCPRGWLSAVCSQGVFTLPRLITVGRFAILERLHSPSADTRVAASKKRRSPLSDRSLPTPSSLLIRQPGVLARSMTVTPSPRHPSASTSRR